MKKSLTILTILAIMLVALTSCVSAASVTVSPTDIQKVEEGETVTVTVNFAQTKAITFTVNYDSANFEFVSTTAASSHVVQPGEVNIGDYGSTSVNLTFKALKAIDVNQQFQVTKIDPGSAVQEDSTATGSLVITPSAEEPITPPAGGEQGGETTPGGGNDSESSETEVPVDKKGNPITEITNAGTPIFAGVIALIVVAGTVLVIKNRK